MQFRIIPFVLLTVCLTGCKGKQHLDQVLDSSEQMTLISIDGSETWKGPTTGEKLFGCSVLGSVEIKNPDHRGEVISAVKEAIRDPQVEMMACWMPRHVLKILTRSQTYLLVICFECHGWRLYREDRLTESIEAGIISPNGQTALDKILKEAEVPVSPKICEK